VTRQLFGMPPIKLPGFPEEPNHLDQLAFEEASKSYQYQGDGVYTDIHLFLAQKQPGHGLAH
jgi:hypothetical protein